MQSVFQHNFLMINICVECLCKTENLISRVIIESNIFTSGEAASRNGCL